MDPQEKKGGGEEYDGPLNLLGFEYRGVFFWNELAGFSDGLFGEGWKEMERRRESATESLKSNTSLGFEQGGILQVMRSYDTTNSNRPFPCPSLARWGSLHHRQPSTVATSQHLQHGRTPSAVPPQKLAESRPLALPHPHPRVLHVIQGVPKGFPELGLLRQLLFPLVGRFHLVLRRRGLVVQGRDGDGEGEELLAAGAHFPEMVRDPRGFRVREGDVEGFDAGRDRGQDGRVHLTAAESQITQLRQLRQHDVQVRGRRRPPLRRRVQLAVGEDDRRRTFGQGVGAGGVESATGQEVGGEAGDVLFQRAGRGELEEFGEVENEDGGHGLVDGEDGVGDGLKAEIRPEIAHFGVVAPALLQLERFRFGQGGDFFAGRWMWDRGLLFCVHPRFVAVFLGFVVEGEGLEVGEQVQRVGPDLQRLVLVCGVLEQQRGEFQHQMAYTGAVAGADGTDPSQSFARVGQIDDGGLVHVGRRFVVDLSIRSQETMGGGVRAGGFRGPVLVGDGARGEFTEAGLLPYVITKLSRQREESRHDCGECGSRRARARAQRWMVDWDWDCSNGGEVMQSMEAKQVISVV